MSLNTNKYCLISMSKKAHIELVTIIIISIIITIIIITTNFYYYENTIL